MSQTKTQLVEGLSLNTSAPATALQIDASGNVNLDSNTLYVDATNNRVGIGTTSPAFSSGDGLEIQRDGTACLRLDDNTNSKAGEIYADSTGLNIDGRGTGAVINFDIGGATKATLDNSGRLLVGTSSSRGNWFNTTNADPLVQLETSTSTRLSITRNDNTDNSGEMMLGNSRSSAYAVVSNNDSLGRISFQGADGSEMVAGAYIQGFVDGTPGANDMPGRLVFSTTADGASSPTERMRIVQDGSIRCVQNGGNFFINTTSTLSNHKVCIAGDSQTVMYLDRNGNDGNLLTFFRSGSEVGVISVANGTVSYNGGHLSRWSQLPSNAERTEILMGSVLSNLDEMCEWAYDAEPEVLWAEGEELPEGVQVGDIKTPARPAGTEENIQLNRMKVSDVEGDPNVAGVFQNWDDEDETYTNDFFCAMTGDFIIRIAAGVTVERGDLLMSAGDGTAKPQDDDIIRSKTIAKVTSTNVSCTYDDGSYCVPCVLMAC